MCILWRLSHHYLSAAIFLLTSTMQRSHQMKSNSRYVYYQYSAASYSVHPHRRLRETENINTIKWVCNQGQGLDLHLDLLFNYPPHHRRHHHHCQLYDYRLQMRVLRITRIAATAVVKRGTIKIKIRIVHIPTSTKFTLCSSINVSPPAVSLSVSRAVVVEGVEKACPPSLWEWRILLASYCHSPLRHHHQQ